MRETCANVLGILTRAFAKRKKCAGAAQQSWAAKRQAREAGLGEKNPEEAHNRRMHSDQ